MDWVDTPQNYKDLYGSLQTLRGSHLNNILRKTLKLSWVAFHSLTLQLRCLDFQSNQYKKLVLVLSRFCNGLLGSTRFCQQSKEDNTGNGNKQFHLVVVVVFFNLIASSSISLESFQNPMSFLFYHLKTACFNRRGIEFVSYG